VTDYAIRPVEDGELRAASDVFSGSLHLPPATDERWKYLRRTYEPGRTLGAFAGDTLIGTALAWGSTLTVPGGANLPMAAVTGVGVRADHTRRGILTELMRQQLTDIAAAGEAFAGLHASETVIYGRYGYGLGTVARHTRVFSKKAQLRPEVPRAGEVRLLGPDEALSALPATYDRMRGNRAGMMARTAGWWAMAYESRLRSNSEQTVVAAHVGPDGYDGFLAYQAYDEPPPPSSPWPGKSLRVKDFQAASQAVANDLWRYLLSVDLIDEIVAFLRPLDEPLEPMLVDQRAVRAEFDDDLFVRLVDVPRALAARTYGDADPVVVEVRDRYLPTNTGRYRIGPHEMERTDAPVDLALDVEALATLYFGSRTASALAGVGRIQVTEPSALPRADRLFATGVAAWCGTMF
jgi:predicted acetyltransferase